MEKCLQLNREIKVKWDTIWVKVFMAKVRWSWMLKVESLRQGRHTVLLNAHEVKVETNGNNNNS